MYGTTSYKRLDVEYPHDTQQTKHPDANLSNYNTQLSRTVLHDENLYGDTSIRPTQPGKYEYVHENQQSETHDSERVQHRRVKSSFDDKLKPVARENGASIQPSDSSVPVVKIQHPVIPHDTHQPIQHDYPSAQVVAETHTRPQVDEMSAFEIATSKQRLIHETTSTIMTKKENYRKCKRQNRLYIFVFVIMLFILAAIVRRLMSSSPN